MTRPRTPHRPVSSAWRRPAVVGGFALPTLVMLHALWSLFAPAGSASMVLVNLPAGTPVRGIADRLSAAGVVRNRFWFIVAARLMHRPLKAGEYGFRRQSAWSVLRQIQGGKVHLHRILVREGESTWQIGETLARAGLADPDAFRRACFDTAALRPLGVPGPSAEGFLFPDTYLIPKSFTEAQAVALMVRRFFDRVPAALIARGKSRKLSLLQLVTLASIVEKEARVPEERPLIAGVFYARLRRGMRLQADPTTLYALGRWDARLTYKLLALDHPYNTYRRAGLPPGPICSPGLACLEAAAAPLATPHLYFVTRKDGSNRHQFSRTMKEHERAIRESHTRSRTGESR